MFAANITRSEAQRRSTLVRTESYEVYVDLTGRDADGGLLATPDTTYYSSTRVRFSGLEDTDTFVNLIADAVVSATLDGVPLDAAAFDGEHLAFHSGVGEHQLEVASVMRYSRTGEGLHRFVDPADGRVYIYSQFESADARRMYATFEQPDQKATFRLTVLAPASWTVLSNSPAPAPIDAGGGVRRWEFAPTKRISTYITALCAGEFHLVSDTYDAPTGRRELSIACRASLAASLDAERILETTKRGFEVFEEVFGQPYPFEDYAQVFVPEFNFGAMENAGCVTFRDEYVFRSRVTAASYEQRDNTILHEMAHMWFGDLVTMKWWDDLWLNESFAEWASHFVQGEIARRYSTGVDPWATFCNQRKTWAYRQDQLPTTHPIAADMYDLEAVELNFDGITYAKGASTLRQLVAFVGLDEFVAGVRTYFAKNAWGNTELADLLAELEASSGRDLSRFTTDWLQTAGVNTMMADFDVDAEGRFASFAVRQSAHPQWPTLRQHRMAIGLYELDGDQLVRTGRVELDVDGPSTDVPELVGARRPDLILLNDDDLTYAKIRFDDRSLATLVAHVAGLPTPLARALCWGATWDMCRDGQLSASDYVDLVLRGVAVEADMTAVSSLLGQARTAIDLYSPRPGRRALASRWSAGVFALLEQAVPGSDHQLALARAASASVTDAAGAARLRGWLDDTQTPTGLVVDADLRWRLLTDLARVGASTPEDVAAERERDATATGAEKAAGALAAMKLADTKADSWRRAVVEDTANETHAQICAQFVQFDQDDLLAPYADRYLDVVGAIAAGTDGWAEKSATIRQHVLTLLFPRPLADRPYLDRLRAWLDAEQPNDFVRRLVTERLDDAERAIRCQEASR
jgi:aminopeptidase N